MSAIVKTMRDNFETLIDTTLPTAWKVLKDKYDIDNNHLNNSSKRFGVKVGSGTGSITITKNYSVDRAFELTLLNKYTLSSSIESIIDILEDALDDITKAAIHNKLGTPQTVLNVELLSIEDIDIDTEDKSVILRAVYNVKYRNSLI